MKSWASVLVHRHLPYKFGPVKRNEVTVGSTIRQPQNKEGGPTIPFKDTLSLV